jgi:hypothetical protein
METIFDRAQRTALGKENSTLQHVHKNIGHKCSNNSVLLFFALSQK